MATYTELFDFSKSSDGSDLQDKISVAVLLKVDAIARKSDVSTLAGES